ncbi:MAG: molybdopterin-dependent oxidoreductase [Firmicutes bacterium]|nr:molybdopterin-dependent oxidoreductase [Bacillota bacterium]MBQ3610695.1 molybdopterin-dependent oxidoreductase [Bacillota bacterium]
MRKKLFALMAVIIMSLTVMTGCGTDDIDISGYDDMTLTLTGVEDEDIVLTVADLKEMECKTIKTESTSDKIGEVKATGPWLDTVLEQYGCTQADFKSIKFYGSDEYDAKLYTEYLAEHPIMLAYGINGEPLDEETKPVRVIIRDSDSAYWVRMVTKIEFEK